MSGSAITTDVAGTISKLNAEQGGNVQKGDVVAVIYPEGAMRIEAQIEEANLGSIAVGDPVSIELIWNQDDEVTYPGVISMISAVANSSQGDSMDGESAVTYNVYVDFTPDANTRYGMTAVVTTLEAEKDITEAEAAPEGPDGTEEPEGVEESPERPEIPEGFEKSEMPEKVTEYAQNQ